ncbi:MAG: glycoside hydrolase family 28 [Paenibacillus sp.]|jgi:hypothetical protein|nr:glycoside hydrolase family 28 [Paenibacillus sp.]
MTTNGIYNVRDYGAVGDGIAKDTEALQRAVDACAVAGGGRVLLPAGTYLSGTVYLKSCVDFHLSAGAKLLGSIDREDYNADDAFPENFASERDNTTGAHLIVAHRQHNVSITGSGVIDGNGSAFFGELPADKVATNYYKTGNYPTLSWRTSQMIWLCRCERVAVRDVALIDSPYWTLFLLGCEDVQIRGLTILNPPATRNGDGIDIDCSRNVTVSDCLIRTGDDCITLRANKRLLGDSPIPCENVAVSNCVLSSPCSAIRVGVGIGEIRDCTFSNIVVSETRTAISFNASYSPLTHGTTIERLHFTDFLVDALNPIVLHPGPGAERPAAIRDISFRRFRITASAGSQLAGSPQVPLERISLADFDWLVRGGTDNTSFVDSIPADLSISGYQGVNGGPALPCALYGVHIHEGEFRNIRVRWEELGAVWHDGIFVEQSTDIEFRDVTLHQPQPEGGAAIRCRRANGLLVQGCRAAAGTDTFLLVEQSLPDTPVRCIANDLSRAKQPVRSDARIE